jgi:hypothetical protein
LKPGLKLALIFNVKLDHICPQKKTKENAPAYLKLLFFSSKEKDATMKDLEVEVNEI